jgi:hypothetical protein
MRGATSSMKIVSAFITVLLAAFEELSCAAPTRTQGVITVTVRLGFSIGYASLQDSSASRCAIMRS